MYVSRLNRFDMYFTGLMSVSESIVSRSVKVFTTEFFLRLNMESFVPNNRHLREVLLYFYNLKKSAAESHRLLVEAYGEHAFSDSMCRRWFRQFKDGIFDVDDAEREGWDMKGVIYHELLKPSETITGDVYRRQLMRLKRAIEEKRPEWDNRHDKIILLHDNARPHIAQPVKNYLERLNWEVLHHPPYSPDIAPSDYYLFRSMQSALSGDRFHSFQSIQIWLNNWIASKDEQFFRDGIRKLPERWANVVASDGAYFQ